jgi:hypothetical protein
VPIFQSNISSTFNSPFLSTSYRLSLHFVELFYDTFKILLEIVQSSIHANLNDFLNLIINFIRCSSSLPLKQKAKRNFITDFTLETYQTVFSALFLHNLPKKITTEAFIHESFYDGMALKHIRLFSPFLLSRLPHSHV